MQDSLTPLQVLGLRWVMLQAVRAGSHLGTTEQMCLDVAGAGYPGAGAEHVRAELDYLGSAGLIVLKRSQVKPWTAKLTQAGRDRRIVAAGFGRYAEHAAWLAGRGHAISQAAIQRYGKRLRRSAELDGAKASEAAADAIARVRQSAELARAINEAAGDDPLDMSARAAELCMVRLYEIAAREDIDAKTLQAISRSLNDSLRAMAAIRSERGEARRDALREARERAGLAMKQRGISADTAAAIRAAIEGPGMSDETMAAVDAVLMPEDGKTPAGDPKHRSNPSTERTS